MAARSGMTTLVQRVRDLSNAGTAEFTLGSVNYFSDNHIQDHLDRHREDLSFCLLVPVQTYTSGGTAAYYDYYLGRGFLESTTGGTAVLVVRDAVGSAIGTADYSVDELRGVVTFGADTQGSARYVDARVYDVYGAAADLLDAWATRLSRQFDFSTDGQSFARSQAAKGLREQAAQLRSQGGRISTARMVRSDVAVEERFSDGRGTRNERWERQQARLGWYP